MRARWNETTERVLSSLEGGKSTAEGVSEGLKAGLSTVRTLLLRLTKQGNAEREKTQEGSVVIDREEGIERPRYVYLYSITEKGRGRLAYIRKSLKQRGGRARKS